MSETLISIFGGRRDNVEPRTHGGGRGAEGGGRQEQRSAQSAQTQRGLQGVTCSASN